MPQQHASSNFGWVGLKAEPKHIGMVIVYDRKTGRIAHTHQFVHFGKGEPPSKASMEQTALKAAGSAGGVHDVLHHHGAPLKAHAFYRVDLDTKSLVEGPEARD
ncbi:MAG: hypothetical protein WBM04_19205 [Candidatus Korobacteraceae bacterium]